VLVAQANAPGGFQWSFGGDGAIDITDLLEFRDRCGTLLPP
jgi:hypothetical protein